MANPSGRTFFREKAHNSTCNPSLLRPPFADHTSFTGLMDMAAHSVPSTPPVRIKVRNRRLSEDPVVGATVSLVGNGSGGASASGTTDARGIVSLNLSGLPDGAYTMGVIPQDTTTDPV